MRKKKHQHLDRLELVLMTYFKMPFSPGYYKRSSGSYYAEKHRYFSYEEELNDTQIQNIIREEMKKTFPMSMFKQAPSIKNELIATYFFKHIQLGYEEDALMALIVPDEERSQYWEVWGVLDDGSILDPLQTEPYLSNFVGNEYDTTNVPSFNTDTQEVTY